MRLGADERASEKARKKSSCRHQLSNACRAAGAPRPGIRPRAAAAGCAAAQMMDYPLASVPGFYARTPGVQIGQYVNAYCDDEELLLMQLVLLSVPYYMYRH